MRVLASLTAGGAASASSTKYGKLTVPSDLVAHRDVEVPRVHELAHDAVDGDVEAFHVLDGGAGVRDAVERGLQPLRALLVRDVAQVGGEERLALHVRARDRDLGRDVLAVGAAGRDLHALAQEGSAAGGEVAGQGAAARMLVRGRGEGLGDGLPRHLRAAVAEGPLRGPVHLHDAALVVHDEHGVGRRLQHGRLQRLALAQRGLPLRPFRRGHRLGRTETPGREAAPDSTKARIASRALSAQDEELDAAARAAFLAHHLAQGLQLAVVAWAGGSAGRAWCPTSSGTGDSKRRPLTLMLSALPSTTSPSVGDARPGLQPHGDARVPPPRHLQELVEAGVPQGGVRLERDHHVRARRAQEVRVGQEGMTAHRRDGGRARLRVLAQAADGAGRVRRAARRARRGSGTSVPMASIARSMSGAKARSMSLRQRTVRPRSAHRSEAEMIRTLSMEGRAAARV